jgi:hypothetical protein
VDAIARITPSFMRRPSIAAASTDTIR